MLCPECNQECGIDNVKCLSCGTTEPGTLLFFNLKDLLHSNSRLSSARLLSRSYSNLSMSEAMDITKHIFYEKNLLPNNFIELTDIVFFVSHNDDGKIKLLYEIIFDGNVSRCVNIIRFISPNLNFQDAKAAYELLRENGASKFQTISELEKNLCPGDPVKAVEQDQRAAFMARYTSECSPQYARKPSEACIEIIDIVAKLESGKEETPALSPPPEYDVVPATTSNEEKFALAGCVALMGLSFLLETIPVVLGVGVLLLLFRGCS